MEAVLRDEKVVWINGAGYGFMAGEILEFKHIADQDVSHLFEWQGDDSDGAWVFLGCALVDLTPISASDLPKSLHIAALTAVDTVNKKGTVVRKWMGENYTYDNCYVSLQALEAYQAGKIKLYNNAFGINAPENADSFVLVYFVSENPYDESLEISVIVDKLVK